MEVAGGDGSGGDDDGSQGPEEATGDEPAERERDGDQDGGGDGGVGPTTVGLDIQATTDLGALPIQPWPGLAVLAAWAAGSILIGSAVLRLRDS